MLSQIEPEGLIIFYPQFEEHERALSCQDKRTEEESRVLASLRVFLDYICKNYQQTPARLSTCFSSTSIAAEGELSA